ncbi:sel1 repeat family protein [Ningiella sp. W23]|uniref:tetratricopeptide repeat protein n=1 Tax=Ningiella sp. W23 TaxID=3023715 RepID=UPI0039F57363
MKMSPLILASTALLCTLIMSTPTSADIFTADRQFNEGEYDAAKQGYLAAAELGNPHAYYQLANIYHKGLGTEKDPINSMLYFYLAAEQKFHNSESVINTILESLPHESKASVKRLLDEHLETHGQVRINEKYFPVVNANALNTQLTFDGEPSLETAFYPEDIEIEDFLPPEMSGVGTFGSDGSDEFVDDSLGLVVSTPKTPFLIIDHDIEPDGSIRYYSEVQKFGYYQPLVEQFKQFGLPVPAFNDAPTHFASRSYLGAAAFNKFTLHQKNEGLYEQVIKNHRKFRQSDDINNRFHLAMLMLNFPWVNQTENEAENILLSLSKLGHSPAMYEYGFKLYREQREIDQAVYWISEASKYGLMRAEYRLAKILQSSPWVTNDETKALYWFESAMAKGNTLARIRAAEILFTTEDETLANYDLAIEYLDVLDEVTPKSPEYYYLNALKYKSGSHRNIKLAVENLETAIRRAQIANWDVSQWQELLRKITTGTIFVTDYEAEVEGG